MSNDYNELAAKALDAQRAIKEAHAEAVAEKVASKARQREMEREMRAGVNYPDDLMNEVYDAADRDVTIAQHLRVALDMLEAAVNHLGEIDRYLNS